MMLALEIRQSSASANVLVSVHRRGCAWQRPVAERVVEDGFITLQDVEGF